MSSVTAIPLALNETLGFCLSAHISITYPIRLATFLSFTIFQIENEYVTKNCKLLPGKQKTGLIAMFLRIIPGMNSRCLHSAM